MDPGQLIDGRYRLTGRLGAGGMSVVWRAHDEVLGRDVAVKVLSPDLAANPDTLRRIRLEARAAAQLRHPHVVEVHDFGETAATDGKPLPYVVMELVEGRSLAQMLTAGALPWRLAVLVGAQVAAALAAAHARGIVHRDVTPNNVMVTASGVKLVDFGISATAGEADSAPEGILGTPAYLAPERLDAGQVRPATDVYALGLLLYRMLAGRLPWAAATTTQMLIAHRYTEPDTLPPVAGLPADVVDLCRRCLAKQPEDRPDAADAADVLGDAAGLTAVSPLSGALTEPLSGALTEPSSGALTEPVAAPSEDLSTVLHPVTPAVTPPAVPVLSRHRRRTLVAAGAAAAVAISGTAVWAVGRPDPRAGDRVVAAPVSPAADVECTVRYAVRSAAGGRAATAVTVVNTGTSPAPSWELTFAVAEGQRLIRGWTGTWRQDGRTVRVRGAALKPGGEVRTGFDARYERVNALPAEFRLGDTLCTSELSVAGAPATPATTTTRSGGRAAGDDRGGNSGPSRPKHEHEPEKPGDDAPKAKGKSKGKSKGKGKGKG